MKVLVIAPHADDETLGVGATMARLTHEGHHVTVVVMTGHGEGVHPLWPRSTWDTVRAEAAEAMSALGVTDLRFRELPAAMLSDHPAHEVRREALAVVEDVRPEVMFVPFLWDLHRDHREVFHAFSVAWRTTTEAGRGIREIYAYETLSQTHWNAPYVEPGFTPNVHVDVADFLDRKLAALRCYKSQMQNHPAARSIEAVQAQAVWRGAQIGQRAAEAFVLIRRLW